MIFLPLSHLICGRHNTSSSSTILYSPSWHHPFLSLTYHSLHSLSIFSLAYKKCINVKICFSHETHILTAYRLFRVRLFIYVYVCKPTYYEGVLPSVGQRIKKRNCQCFSVSVELKKQVGLRQEQYT